MYANAQKISSYTIASGGSGYKVDDIVAVYTDDSSKFSSAAFKVKTVDGSGAVTSLSVLDYGGFLDAPDTTYSPYGGTGTGLSLTLVFTLYWQNSAWVVPVVGGLETLLSVVVQNPVASLSDQVTSRGTEAIRLVVQRIRAAIAIARRTPLSLTAGSVPPEAESHTYALALQIMIGSNPALAKYAMSEAGASKTPLAMMIDDAVEWLKTVKDGKTSVEYPSDPDASFKFAISEGAMSDTEDLTTFSAPNYNNTPDDWNSIGQP